LNSIYDLCTTTRYYGIEFTRSTTCYYGIEFVRSVICMDLANPEVFEFIVTSR